MNITSWNVNSVRRRLERVLEWVDDRAPDVLCLQELKCQDPEFPAEAFAARGYHMSVYGQKAYNGVAILSKLPQTDVVIDFPVPGDGQARGIAATIGGVRVVNLYVVNGGELNSDKYQYKLKWLDGLIAWVQAERERWSGPMVVCGDFNIAPADADVWDPVKWGPDVLCSPPERARFEALLALGFSDSWRALHPSERVFTWWDYRSAGFDRNEGLRIDHHLISGITALDVSIDHDARARPESSDHAPVTLFVREVAQA